RPGILRAVGSVFLQKQLRSCLTETIDALLDIAHHENIISAVLKAGDAGEKHFLNVIAVLILVNHNLGKARRQLLRRLGAQKASVLLLPDEDLQSKMLQIRKIQKVLLPLLRGERVDKLFRKK